MPQTTDRRDQRDPETLGRALLHLHKTTGNKRLSVTHDGHRELLGHTMPYSPTESTVDETKALYQKQMTEQAEKGDAAARIVCDEHAWAYVVPEVASERQNGREPWALQCVEATPHPPHIWSRWDGEHSTAYACPGVS